jgi:transcriptional regulator with XRE-family HTH domain
MTKLTKDNEWIGSWIRDARNHWGRNQEELGKALLTTKANVSAWENNRHSPSIQQLTRISEITGYPLPEQILGRLSLEARELGATPTLSAQAMEVAAAFDRLSDPTKQTAIVVMLQAWGVLK